MEKMLQRLAEQLKYFDEASLTDLWDKYEARVQDFHPSRNWEDAALILCLIQAVRWKNQLFNLQMKGRGMGPAPEASEDAGPQKISMPLKGKILPFPSK
jgi:hypothetical protein